MMPRSIGRLLRVADRCQHRRTFLLLLAVMFQVLTGRWVHGGGCFRAQPASAAEENAELRFAPEADGRHGRQRC
jgi:hypothetical protein